MTARSYYRPLPIETVMRAVAPAKDGRPRIERLNGLPDVRVELPPVFCGQVDPPSGDYTEWPQGGWVDQSYVCQGFDRYEIRDAVVHGEQGFITVDDSMILESMHFGSIEHTDFQRVDEHVLGVEGLAIGAEVMRGAHMLCGFVGNRNYAHWWVDILSTFQGPPFGTAYDDTVPLLPELRASWQRRSLGLLPEIPARALFLSGSTRIACESLTYIPALGRSDLTPHPSVRTVLSAVRDRAGTSGRRDRRIYVNRKDAAARRLVNEEEIEALLARHGFESVTLGGLGVAEQVRLFGEASHVVGAHGAGLANVLFCRPGACLLELHMQSSVIWSIRRLSGLALMRYACLLGETVREATTVDERHWRLPAERLEAALAGFLSDPSPAAEADTR